MPSSPSDPVAATPPKKIWHAGTLTYTTAALVPLFCWLLFGDFAWSMKERACQPVLQLLLKKFEASDKLTGFLLASVPQLVAVIIVPILSFRSDHYRSRWGRRIPFLLIPAPLAALSMFGLAIGPWMGANLHRALGAWSPGLNPSILIVLGVFWAIFEFTTMFVQVLFAALVNDVVPREIMGRFYGMFRALSLIAGMVYYHWVHAKAEVHYFWVFSGIGLLYGVGLTLMCLKVKEGKYPPPPPIEPGQSPPVFLAAKTYLRECFTKPYYLLVFATISISTIAWVPINTFNIYFAKSVKMSDASYSNYLTWTYIISLSLAYAYGWLADKFHPLRVGLVAIAFYALATLWGGLFARDSHTFGIALLAHGVLSGSWLTMTASLPQRLLPPAKFAQFAGAAFVVQSLSWATVGALTGEALDYSGHVYRYTYYFGSALAVAGLVCGLLLYRQYVALGGDKSYCPPE